jgi:hypothetical protein
MTADSLVERVDAAPVSGEAARHNEYRCQCGHGLRVFGTGRHRVYFGPADARFDDPMMNGACPTCGRELPGKRRL